VPYAAAEHSAHPRDRKCKSSMAELGWLMQKRAPGPVRQRGDAELSYAKWDARVCNVAWGCRMESSASARKRSIFQTQLIIWSNKYWLTFGLPVRYNCNVD
jgi:hypothetical protein